MADLMANADLAIGGGVESMPDWAVRFGDEVQRGLETGLDEDALETWAFGLGKNIEDGLQQGMDLSKVLDGQVSGMDKFKAGAEGLFETGSPSKWAERLGESVSQGFDGTAIFTPQMGELPDMAVQQLMEDAPQVDAQDMAVSPFLTDTPQLPDLDMGVTPYLLDIPALEAQTRVEAATPPEMAMGGNSSTVNNQKTYQLDYTGVSQEEVGILSLFTMQEMKSGG